MTDIETNSETVIQEPGDDIKPKLHDSEISRLLDVVFGLDVIRFKELVSYDDKNYHVKVKPTSRNNYISSVHEQGYVLKVMNSMDSKRPVSSGKYFKLGTVHLT